ncbi:hypothetical protein M0R45_015731 [Rubus argutus]|uniref:Uncharacterized protein n=1 Tax=Rubus argutus TaxID=59490 RepID=A0AAW1XQY9_RUBAR
MATTPMEEFRYLLYQDPRSAAFFIGVPVRELSSGQLAAFVDPEVPLITVNVNTPPLILPHRPDPFFRVGMFNATLGEDGQSVIMASPRASTHREGRFAVPWSSLLWKLLSLLPRPSTLSLSLSLLPWRSEP